MLTVVGSVLLASDHGFWVEERPVKANFHIFDSTGLKIHIQGSWNMFSSTGLRKESSETMVSGLCCRIFLETTIRLT
jgi:hypothetical protein